MGPGRPAADLAQASDRGLHPGNGCGGGRRHPRLAELVDRHRLRCRHVPIFGLIVGIEVLLAVGGSFLLSRRGRRQLVAPWVALVVGVHFFPMAPLLGYPLFYVVAALITIAALVSVPVARSRDITVSAVTGAMCGTILLAAAVFSLLA